MKLALVKVVVQPFFVIIDGDEVSEQVAEPVTVPAADWPTFATTEFVRATNELQAQLDEHVKQRASENLENQPNRKQRRATPKR